MTPSSAADEVARIVENVPFAAEDKIALEASLRQARSLPLDESLRALDDIVGGLASRCGGKFPKVGSSLTELRVRMLRELSSLRQAKARGG